MLCITDSHTDPYFNLAAEEYVLKQFTEDCFMLWRNERCIIVGKHQNTLAEINLDFVREKNIKVVRRISGGGTVFHDPGNLNFTFIMAGEPGRLVDFRKFTWPILSALHAIDIDAEFEGRNNLTIGGKKFSGNAEHVWKNRTLHHGTLLFSSGLTDLNAALKVDSHKFKDNAVKSIRSNVTNIKEHLKVEMDVLKFRDYLKDHIRKIYADLIPYTYSQADITEIEKLRDEKYVRWEWNFGYSPKYDFENIVRTGNGSIELRIKVEKGYIMEISVFSDLINAEDIESIEKLLTGIKHEPETILKSLFEFSNTDFFNTVSPEAFVSGMF